VKLAKVIEFFAQTVMSLMSSIAHDRRAEIAAQKSVKTIQEHHKLRVLEPLSTWVQQKPLIPSPSSPLSFRPHPNFDAAHVLGPITKQSSDSFFEKVLNNHTFVDRMLNYVEHFIKCSKIKWQCVLEFSLYIVEVAFLYIRSIEKRWLNVVCPHQINTLASVQSESSGLLSTYMKQL
jgi:hypothetical protein